MLRDIFLTLFFKSSTELLISTITSYYPRSFFLKQFILFHRHIFFSHISENIEKLSHLFVCLFSSLLSLSSNIWLFVGTLLNIKCVVWICWLVDFTERWLRNTIVFLKIHKSSLGSTLFSGKLCFPNKNLPLSWFKIRELVISLIVVVQEAE